MCVSYSFAYVCGCGVCSEGIRRVLEAMTGVPHPRDQPVDTSRIQEIRMGTTVATNALLERQGERTVLITTKGFRDLLYIGNQSRPKIFDLEIQTPDVSALLSHGAISLC